LSGTGLKRRKERHITILVYERFSSVVSCSDGRLLQASAQMKTLNSRFGMLHGISSLANLFAVIALAFHGLWLGNSGIKGY
jgi:hypothetical protein